jgi:hypothetical protein
MSEKYKFNYRLEESALLRYMRQGEYSLSLKILVSKCLNRKFNYRLEESALLRYMRQGEYSLS